VGGRRQRDAAGHTTPGGLSQLATGPTDSRVLDLRTYRIAPGGREEFDRAFREGALPMLRRYGIEVVGYGPSVVDDEHYYLARAFSSPAEREELLGAFYGSEEWKSGYDEVVKRLVVGFHLLVIPLTPEIGRALAGAA
jgi:NIPSNAP